MQIVWHSTINTQDAIHTHYTKQEERINQMVYICKSEQYICLNNDVAADKVSYRVNITIRNPVLCGKSLQPRCRLLECLCVSSWLR